MKFALPAFVFGTSLFVLSRAALAPESEDASGPWWLLMLAIAVLHGASGFFAIGGAPACATKHWKAVAKCAAASMAVTAVSVLAAVFLASCVLIMVSAAFAIGIAAVAVLVG